MRPTSPEQFLNSVHWNLRHQRDMTIELRGPKGYGKSSLAHWMRKRLSPGIKGYSDLVLSHKDYVRRYKELRTLRRKGDATIQFLWVDDATRVFNRRNAMNRRNKAVLDINRMSRDSIQAVQFLLTQDDLLERPLMEIGPYALFILDTPYRAWYCDFRRDAFYRGDPIPRKAWWLTWPNPEDECPDDWALYQSTRRERTDALTTELLGEAKGNVRLGAPSKLQPGDHNKIRSLSSKGRTYKSIGDELGISPQRVGQVIAQYR